MYVLLMIPVTCRFLTSLVENLFIYRPILSAIGDILRHRRLSLFGHVARLDPGVPAHDALRLMVDTYTKAESQWSCIWRRPPGRPRNVLAQQGPEDAN